MFGLFVENGPLMVDKNGKGDDYYRAVKCILSAVRGFVHLNMYCVVCIVL